MYNNSTTIEFIPAATFVFQYQASMYSEEEKLLDVTYSNNISLRDLQVMKIIIQAVIINCLIASFFRTYAK